MSEAESRAKHIDPALKAVGWGVVGGSIILREYAPDFQEETLKTVLAQAELVCAEWV